MFFFLSSFKTFQRVIFKITDSRTSFACTLQCMGTHRSYICVSIPSPSYHFNFNYVKKQMRINNYISLPLWRWHRQKVAGLKKRWQHHHLGSLSRLWPCRVQSSFSLSVHRQVVNEADDKIIQFDFSFFVSNCSLFTDLHQIRTKWCWTRWSGL